MEREGERHGQEGQERNSEHSFFSLQMDFGWQLQREGDFASEWMYGVRRVESAVSSKLSVSLEDFFVSWMLEENEEGRLLELERVIFEVAFWRLWERKEKIFVLK